ncbi:MAG TPA: hypothetical protein EYQ49_06655 [Acidimicrobiia bacterium]|jgi:hypothetical protein|nr:hypothetical protein [Acidimicrobiia bacterium]
MSETMSKIVGLTLFAALVLFGISTSDQETNFLSRNRALPFPLNDLTESQPELTDKDELSTWSGEERNVEGGQLREPEDPSAVDNGTLQEYTSQGIPAFVQHYEMYVAIPEMRFNVPSPIGVLAYCNYLYEACEDIGDGWDSTLFETYQLSTQNTFTGEIHSKQSTDKYLNIELQCPDVVTFASETLLPSIIISRNNKYAQYGFSRSSDNPPWAGIANWEYEASNALNIPASFEQEGTEFLLLSRPWATQGQKRLSAFYYTVYSEADAVSYSFNGQLWHGFSAYWDFEELYGSGSASDFLRAAIHEMVVKPNPMVPYLFYPWDGASLYSLVGGVEQWPPPVNSFWSEMQGLVEPVPETVSERALIRIFDGSLNHWAFVSADLTFMNSNEGGSSTALCSADVAITRSYQ